MEEATARRLVRLCAWVFAIPPGLMLVAILLRLMDIYTPVCRDSPGCEWGFFIAYLVLLSFLLLFTSALLEYRLRKFSALVSLAFAAFFLVNILSVSAANLRDDLWLVAAFLALGLIYLCVFILLVHKDVKALFDQKQNKHPQEGNPQ